MPLLAANSYRGAQRALIPVAADDGDELRFCSTCAFSEACLSQGYHKSALAQLHVLVEHKGPYAAGQHIFREGDDFNSVAAVRGGVVKTYRIDRNGREQVVGFHLPGEVIGFGAIHSARYPVSAVALDSALLCVFSFPKLAMLAACMPTLQHRLFSLMSQDINGALVLAGDYSADERLAAFLLNVSERLSQRGFSGTCFHLMMARTDIASYLRLAPETVSRVLRRMSNDGLIEVEGRLVTIRDEQRLHALGAAVLGR